MQTNLINLLSQIQNDAAHQHHDIMTFAGFCDNEAELINHIAAEFEHSLRHMREFKPSKSGRYVRRKALTAA